MTWNKPTKHSATYNTQNATGKGWNYDSATITYEMANLFYELFGTAPSWAKQNKNTSTFNQLTKH